MTRHRKPVSPPLSRTEREVLDRLVRRGAGSMNAIDGNRLLRLWELDQADRTQERRTLGGAQATVGQLRTQLEKATNSVDTARWCLREELEQADEMCVERAREVARYRGAWQSARARAAHTSARLDATLELPAVQAYMATLTYDDEPPAHDSYVIEEDGELHARCADCPAFVDNIGDQDDARRWAEDHKADPTPYGEPS